MTVVMIVVIWGDSVFSGECDGRSVGRQRESEIEGNGRSDGFL